MSTVNVEEVKRQGAINAFMKVVRDAEKNEEVKQLDGIKVELGVNSYWGDKVDSEGKKPYTFWYYVNVSRAGWGYYVEFDVDYEAAKKFFDSCNVFARLLAMNDDVKQKATQMERQVWMQHCLAFHGKQVRMEGVTY